MARKQKSIRLVCRPSSIVDGCDGRFLAVRFDRAYLIELLTVFTLARSLATRSQNFLWVTHFDYSPAWLKCIVSEDGSLPKEAWHLLDVAGAWTKMPCGWLPREPWKARIDVPTIRVGKDDVTYEWREKHVDYDLESPPLSEQTLRDMPARVQ